MNLLMVALGIGVAGMVAAFAVDESRHRRRVAELKADIDRINAAYQPRPVMAFCFVRGEGWKNVPAEVVYGRTVDDVKRMATLVIMGAVGSPEARA